MGDYKGVSDMLDSKDEEIASLKRRLATYASHIHQLMEGDTHHIGQMYADLRADGFADEDGFPIYPEDEEDYTPKYSKKKVAKDG